MVVVALELGPITATFKLDLGESGSTFVECVGSTAQCVCACVCVCVCVCVVCVCVCVCVCACVRACMHE